MPGMFEMSDEAFCPGESQSQKRYRLTEGFRFVQRTDYPSLRKDKNTVGQQISLQ